MAYFYVKTTTRAGAPITKGAFSSREEAETEFSKNINIWDVPFGQPHNIVQQDVPEGGAGNDPNTGLPLPTVGSLYTPPTGQSEADKASAALLATYGTTPPVLADEFKTQLGNLQTQIDAMNNFYAQKKAEITKQYATQSEKELGSLRALQAGTGMAGQFSGLGQKSDVQLQQEQRVKGATDIIDAEQQSKVQAILTGAQQQSQSIYDKKMEDYRKGQTLKSLNEMPARRTEALTSKVKEAILTNWDLSNETEAKKLADSFNTYGLGISVSDIQAEYKSQKTAKDIADKELAAKRAKEAADLAKTASETAENIAQAYKLQHPEAKTQEVRGGIYDITNKKWIVNPNDSTEYKFSSDDIGRLLNTGLSQTDITTIQNEIKQYGAEKVKEQLRKTGTEQQVNALDQVLKGITSTQAKDETQRTMNDTEIKDYIKEFYKKAYTKEDLTISFRGDKDTTQADKDEAIKILEQMIPEVMNEWLKKVQAKPNEYKIKDDGIYQVKTGWFDKKVYSF